MNVSEYLLKRLKEWGLNRAYGYPGDGIAGIDLALQKAVDRGDLEYVQVRHEEMAAFMASAHAKFTGQPGLCIATSGPGAIHLLNGLYDAKLDHVGVVAIMGQQASSCIGASYQQEVDLQSLCKDLANDYVVTVTNPYQIRHAIDRAVRIARDKRVPTVVIIPNDVQIKPFKEAPNAHAFTHTGIGETSLAHISEIAGLHEAARILNEGDRVAILAGAGALNATEELLTVAETLGAGIAKALLGKATVPDHYPFVTGSMGLLGTKPSWDMMKECDTLLMVGSCFPYSEFLPDPGKAKGVQIDIEPANLSLRYPMDICLQGDSASVLKALLPLLKPKSSRKWRKKIEHNVASWWKLLEKRAMQDATPLNPQRVFWELSPRLPDNAVITADSGSVANWYARDLKFRAGMKGSLSGGLASLGAGTPYAISAKMAFPERTVIACMGDGAMQMNGINEMITISKYWKNWSNPKLIVLVLNNEDLNQVTWEERAQSGAGKTEVTQSIPDFPFAKYAELLGLRGIFVNAPDQIGAAWDEALNADRPVILEAKTDPNVPPLPPHITLSQAKAFMTSLIDEPERSSTIANSARQVLALFLPRRRS